MLHSGTDCESLRFEALGEISACPSGVLQEEGLNVVKFLLKKDAAEPILRIVKVLGKDQISEITSDLVELSKRLLVSDRGEVAMLILAQILECLNPADAQQVLPLVLVNAAGVEFGTAEICLTGLCRRMTVPVLSLGGSFLNFVEENMPRLRKSGISGETLVNEAWKCRSVKNWKVRAMVCCILAGVVGIWKGSVEERVSGMIAEMLEDENEQMRAAAVQSLRLLAH
jgi:hypothetical protein